MVTNADVEGEIGRQVRRQGRVWMSLCVVVIVVEFGGMVETDDGQHCSDALTHVGIT